MRYEGPIYRPPSEAQSLLIQATVGCPHNRCSFCMVYKNGPRYRARPVADIKTDMDDARRIQGPGVATLFLPAGNTIAMKTDDLSEICDYARRLFPDLQRITVYGSSQYILRKGPEGLNRLAKAGLSRIHVGLESGDDAVLKHIQKGTTAEEQIAAGQMVRRAGIELSLYVIIGIGGKARSAVHAQKTADAINAIAPDFVRLRTFVPKVNTPLLAEVENGAFHMVSPHEALRETATLIGGITVSTEIASDHYTNYINVAGRLPENQQRMLHVVREGLHREESEFRPFFVGTE